MPHAILAWLIFLRPSAWRRAGCAGRYARSITWSPPWPPSCCHAGCSARSFRAADYWAGDTGYGENMQFEQKVPWIQVGGRCWTTVLVRRLQHLLARRPGLVSASRWSSSHAGHLARRLGKAELRTLEGPIAAPRATSALFLLLETGVLGTFAALDFFLFYIFWEVMLLPSYFLIGV